MQFVGNVTTPTLLLTGENDMRTNPVEAERFYQALLREGVPTKLIYMRDEWHGTTSKPTNMLRTQMMLRKWFEEWDPKPVSD
jgi:dipeptidyl aminopeptidase/acylaminoacyl peptidase